MLTYKMQKEFNKIGYTDFNGEKLKEDGIYGNKTKSVYEKYKKDNTDDYIEVLKNKQGYESYENSDTPDNESSNVKYVSYSKQNDDTKEHTKTLEKKNNKENSYNFDDLVVKNSNGEPLYLASIGRDLNGLIPQESIMVAQGNENLNKTLTENKDNSNKNNTYHNNAKNSQYNLKFQNNKKNEIDRDKEVLSKEDYEKIQIFKAIYTYAKDELKDDAIADSMHREAVAIRQQEKYSIYEDYGPKRIKKFDLNNGLQYIGIEGYADSEYEYSDTKDNATIIISEPLSADSAEWEAGRYAGYISNANAFTGPMEDANFYADILDWILSKTHPLYNKVSEGDIVVTVKRHKGGYKGIAQKEYKFYFGQDKSKFYYVK